MPKKTTMPSRAQIKAQAMFEELKTKHAREWYDKDQARLAELKEANTNVLMLTHKLRDEQAKVTNKEMDVQAARAHQAVAERKLKTIETLTSYGEPNGRQMLLHWVGDKRMPEDDGMTKPDPAPASPEARAGYLAGILQAIRTIAG